MLQITIPACELWDERKQEFVSGPEKTLQLEHSLVSISKWESKWCKAFFKDNNKSDEEIYDYIRCMTITQNVNPDVYNRLTTENMNQIHEYINAPMSATICPKDNRNKSRSETVTAELIYYWMIALQIPDKYEKWHINRLLTLIEVCNIKNAPPKKRSKRDIMSRNHALNEARKKQLSTRG